MTVRETRNPPWPTEPDAGPQAANRRQEAPHAFIGCMYIDRTRHMHEMLMTDAFIFLTKTDHAEFILSLGPCSLHLPLPPGYKADEPILSLFYLFKIDK